MVIRSKLSWAAGIFKGGDSYDKHTTLNEILYIKSGGFAMNDP